MVRMPNDFYNQLGRQTSQKALPFLTGSSLLFSCAPAPLPLLLSNLPDLIKLSAFIEFFSDQPLLLVRQQQLLSLSSEIFVVVVFNVRVDMYWQIFASSDVHLHRQPGRDPLVLKTSFAGHVL